MHISLEASHLAIHWSDDTVSVLPYLWLRDTDPAGFHHQTGERTFDLTSVALDIVATRAVLDNNTLVVTWPDQSAPSRLPLDWIRQHQPGKRREDPASVRPTLWRASQGGVDMAANIARFPADALLQSDATLNEWLRATKRDGLTFVDGLDDTIDAGKAVAACSTVVMRSSRVQAIDICMDAMSTAQNGIVVFV